MKTLITEKELSELLGIKPGTLRKWRVLGEGPKYRKIGGLVRYATSDLQAYLDAVPSGAGHVRGGANSAA